MRPNRPSLLAASVFAIAWLGACDHEHGHGDDHEHANGHDHDEGRADGHDHANDHPPGHDHHADGHGHGDTPVLRITRWSEGFELFAEHPPALVGREVALLTHLTVLEDFRPLDGGEVRLELGGVIVARSDAAVRPGIHRLTFVPKEAGKHSARIVVSGNAAGAIDGFAIEVFDDAIAAAKAAPEEHDEGAFIELLKEQQWGVPFATAFAATGALVASIEVAGEVTTPPGGSAEVGAPIAGRLIAPESGLPRPGDAVRKGQLLATLAPAPSSPEAAARASLAVAEAEARVGRAHAATERSERLIADRAISQREVEDARSELAVAREALRAATEARKLFAGATQGAGKGSWRLVAPIDGTLSTVKATPGASVAQGEVLFGVVDTTELWIRARIPEQDAARLRSDRDASFQLAGLDDFVPIHITGDDASSSLVTVGRTVDPTSRTVDVIYALRTPDPRLRVGGLVRVSVPAGEDFAGVVVPTGALIDDAGRQLVYVQVDGEHFEERIVRTGPRHGDAIAITDGLKPGERIVVRGAQVVRLAARADSSQAHGHIH